MDWYLKCLRDYATFSGRARRTEYWMFFLFNIIVSIFFSVIDAAMLNFLGFKVFLESLYSLAVLIPSIAVGVRRLHDTNRTGWWMLLSFVPIIGWIILLVFMVQNSDPEFNDYGANPKLSEG